MLAFWLVLNVCVFLIKMADSFEILNDILPDKASEEVEEKQKRGCGNGGKMTVEKWSEESQSSATKHTMGLFSNECRFLSRVEVRG